MSALILMYHGVEDRDDPLFVPPSLFAEHVAVIASSGLPVLTVGELADRLRDGELPERAIVMTFDDGFASVARDAAPRLLERGLRATVFCVAGRLGGTNAWPTGRPGAVEVALAGAHDLTRLAADGFEIGAHGMEHSPLDTEEAEEIRREVVEAATALEHAVGTAPRSFAYPYGAGPSKAAARVVSETYAAACTTRIGRVHEGSSALDLPRVDAHYLRSPELLAAAIGGGSNAYLALRRVAASARRRVRRDYVRPPVRTTTAH
jgi:peptidoglycan/xylan/chitin deacetylase (PgdA/CDA1 family)